MGASWWIYSSAIFICLYNLTKIRYRDILVPPLVLFNLLLMILLSIQAYAGVSVWNLIWEIPIILLASILLLGCFPQTLSFIFALCALEKLGRK